MTGPPRDTGCGGCTVLAFCVLSGLDGESLSQVERIIQRIPYATDETIFHQGAPVLGYHILCQGLAKLYAQASRGRRVLFKFSGPGDLLGGPVAEVYRASAQAMEDSLVAFIDEQAFSELLRDHPRVALEVIRRIGQDRDLLAARLVAIAYGNVRSQLVSVLLELGERHGVQEGGGIRINIPLSLRDVAEMIGCTPQTASEELHKLAKKGLVKVAWPRIFILDAEDLRRLG